MRMAVLLGDQFQGLGHFLNFGPWSSLEACDGTRVTALTSVCRGGGGGVIGSG